MHRNVSALIRRGKVSSLLKSSFLAGLIIGMSAVTPVFGQANPSPFQPLPGQVNPVTPPPAVVPPPALAPDAKQVVVSVKIVEFQTSTRTETGLSSYLAKRANTHPWKVGGSGVSFDSANITFPATTGGLNVFLDRMHIGEHDLEMVLQALVDENRAFILSRPKAMVTVGSPIPTLIETTSNIPYENTVVVGSATTQITSFKATGVKMSVTSPQVIDDDGNPLTTDDTFIQLTLDVTVTEEGSRIVVALDNSISSASSSVFSGTSNAISVPTFVNRQLTTNVFVRSGQVLMLGGLYRNTKTKNISTLPWLMQGEDMAAGLIEKIPPHARLNLPLSSMLGNKVNSGQRRELVFFVKAELWAPAFTVGKDLLEDDKDKVEEKKEEEKKPDAAAAPAPPAEPPKEGAASAATAATPPAAPEAAKEGDKKDGDKKDADKKSAEKKSAKKKAKKPLKQIIHEISAFPEGVKNTLQGPEKAESSKRIQDSLGGGGAN